MGSSAKKKKEKKKDFQKQKLKVGKTKAKPDSFTDTSFRSKSIVLSQQALHTSAPTALAQFSHYLSLASTSRSDTQRRDALSFLASTLSGQPVSDPLPVPAAMILPKLLPLVLDGSAGVRANLLRVLKQLPAADVADRAETVLLYVRAGMTHLAAEIRSDALAVLEWLLHTAPEEAVSCPGGWMKTLRAFLAMLGWAVSGTQSKWTTSAAGATDSAATLTMGSKASFGKGGKALPRQLQVLAQFLKAGVVDEYHSATGDVGGSGSSFPLHDARLHTTIPRRSNAYAYLNLFGSTRDEDGEMYLDREDRQRVFQQHLFNMVERGVATSRLEGGEAGRTAAVLARVLADGTPMDDGEE